MAALRTAVSLLGLYDDEADIMSPEANYRKAIRFKQNCQRLLLHLHEFVKV